MKTVERINPEKIFIARKWSGVEWDCKLRGITPLQLYREMSQRGDDVDNYFGAHEDQLKACETVGKMFGAQATMLVGEILTRQLLRPASLVVSLGGDNHLQYVSHFVGSQPVLGINSDYKRSEGGMEYYTPADLEKLIPRLLEGSCLVEDWARLRATIMRSNGSLFRIPQEAISEIYVGTWARISMSKYRDESERHKDSGALIALPAGAGDGSWFNSAGGNIEVDHRGVSRSERKAWYLSTEKWSGRTLQSEKGLVEITPDTSSLTLAYSSYYKGTVSIDPKEGSRRNYALNRGDRAVIEFSDTPLRMIGRSNYASE
jgi:hypothetical protein